MVSFGGPEGRGGRHARHHVVTPGAKGVDQPQGDVALCGGRVEDLRAVLVADVGTLPVGLRRVVDLEEEPCELLVADPARVEAHAHRLGMSRGVAAHLLVGRMVLVAADVARFDVEHSGTLREHVLHTPEAPSGEDRRLLGRSRRGRLLLFGKELQRDGVHAVARVLGREALVQEDVAQVGAAAGAGDLRTHAVGIGGAAHGPGDLVVEARPAASRVELVGRAVERRAALAADVGARLAVVVELSGEGGFGSLLFDDPFLFGCQRFHGLCVQWGSRATAEERQEQVQLVCHLVFRSSKIRPGPHRRTLRPAGRPDR